MALLHLIVPDAVVEGINRDIAIIHAGTPGAPAMSANDIGREALAVYQWVVSQISAGNMVVATNADKTKFTAMETPALPFRKSA
jgi:hypothetical protein